MSPGFFVGLEIVPPHPSPLPQGGEGEREPICVVPGICIHLGVSGRFALFLRSTFTSDFQVDVPRQNNSVGSLSLGERARVRVLLLFQAA
jgi:hypothetical protein